MNIEQAMKNDVFVVAGDTINSEKYACKIKNALLQNGYTVHCVGKELKSINEISGEIEVIDLCINPARGLDLLKECKKKYKGVVIQPGAESEEILAFLEENKVPYVEGCVLKGLEKYPRNK